MFPWSYFLRLNVGIICLASLLGSSCTSSKEEPPFSLGSGGRGEMIRKTSLKEMLGDPPRIVYEVEYSQTGLTSLATLDFATHAMLEEVFEGKWRIEYEYRDMSDKALKVPSAIVIYKDRDASRELINRYERIELVPQEGARYKDKNGRMKLISYDYFDVMPGGL